jgi:type IV pilus assembly protein PilA
VDGREVHCHNVSGTGRACYDRIVRRSKGFTLIELMIVVAIIALLAAIAIPNFLKFQCKSKQSEVKAGLGAWYVSEKTFLAEHNTYGTDLVVISWEPEGAPLYLYGFAPSVTYPTVLPGIMGWDATRNNTSNPGVIGTPPGYSTARMVTASGNALPAASLPGIVCNGQAFVLGAIGDINPDATLGLDIWVMDNTRQLMVQSNDCTNGL